MGYIAVDKDGSINVFTTKPSRHHNGVCWLWSTKGRGEKKSIMGASSTNIEEDSNPYGLTWADEPLKIKK